MNSINPYANMKFKLHLWHLAANTDSSFIMESQMFSFYFPYYIKLNFNAYVELNSNALYHPSYLHNLTHNLLKSTLKTKVDIFSTKLNKTYKKPNSIFTQNYSCPCIRIVIRRQLIIYGKKSPGKFGRNEIFAR